MKKNVLIIEDNQADFERIRNIFLEYDIGVLPTNEDYKSFAKLLMTFGNSRSNDLLNKIKEKINSYNFDHVILDRSFTQSNVDNSGEIVEKNILQVDFPNIGICYLTNYTQDANSDNYIDKKDYVSWEVNLFSKVISKMTTLNYYETKINSESAGNTNLNEDLKNEHKPEILRNITALPKWINFLIQKERFKLLPSVSYFIDATIKYLFYGSLLSLFLYGTIFIFISIFKDFRNPLIIAEQTFIVFLPFLIACGFYVFYIKSLSPYIKQKPVDKDDFESSSILLVLTKKLFVTSLLSYLFIKLLELLFLDKEEKAMNLFAKLYGTENKLFMLYFLIGFIFILILYYFLIAINNNNKIKK